MSELKPCPYCGERSDIVVASHPIVDGWGVTCGACHASSYVPATDDDQYDETEAIAAWNRRTPGPATAKMLEIYVSIMRHEKLIDVPWATVDDVRAFIAEWPTAHEHAPTEAGAGEAASPN